MVYMVRRMCISAPCMTIDENETVTKANFESVQKKTPEVDRKKKRYQRILEFVCASLLRGARMREFSVQARGRRRIRAGEAPYSGGKRYLNERDARGHKTEHQTYLSRGQPQTLLIHRAIRPYCFVVLTTHGCASMSFGVGIKCQPEAHA
jgi:hypothetical protein